jgi:hypothetical protein
MLNEQDEQEEGANRSPVDRRRPRQGGRCGACGFFSYGPKVGRRRAVVALWMSSSSPGPIAALAAQQRTIVIRAVPSGHHASA